MKLLPPAIPAAAALFSSCAPTTTGITVNQVAAMNRPGVTLPSRLTLRMTVKEPWSKAKELPARRITVGRKTHITEGREFIYPSSYEPASASADMTSVVPANPKEFQKTDVGMEADLTSERSGGLLLIKGTIKVTEFQGFSETGGRLGQPIIDSKGRLITENVIMMPKFATFTTPVYAAIPPDGSCTFEISHPKRGTSVTLSIADTSSLKR
jgi:hypothetical protein